MLWPDTFNNYFHPSTARAAVEVLETAGYRVVVPHANLCCGRPLYDFGMLDRAQTLLLQILDELEPEIEAGIPIIGLEPSCISVFRDELLNLFPKDERAQKLARQTFLLSEFLERELVGRRSEGQQADDPELHQVAPPFPRTLREGGPSPAPLPQLNRKALLHGHCHHKSIMKMTAEESLLRRLGVDFTVPAPGCCGMAGSFGFERDKDKYEVSRAIGELELLPAVRSAPKDWLIIADGFSCREQISQGTDRHALHLAEVIQMALNPKPETQSAPYPESPLVTQRHAEVHHSIRRAAMSLGTVAAGAGILWAALSRK
jgi:Fe-S oxidoreductase